MNPITTVLLLILCAVLSLAGTDLVLPAIPQLPGIFSSTEAVAQLVLAAYAAGSALGLLLFGWLADHFKRQHLLVSSLLVFAAVSAACVFATDIYTLIALRLVQGAASAAAPVFGPGIIRQLFREQAAVRATGILGSAESLSPALAPIVGVALLAHFGWSSSFVLLALLALGAAALIQALGLPREATAVAGTQGSYRQLLGDRVYLRYALSHALVLGGLLTFVLGAPTVLIATMDATLNDFIVMQVVNVSSFIVAANLTTRVSARLGVERVILWGTLLMAASALAMLGYGLLGGKDARLLALLFLPMGIGLGLRAPPGFYRGIVASGSNHARGAALMVFLTLILTTLGTVVAAPVITSGLASLLSVVVVMYGLAVALLCGLPVLEQEGEVAVVRG
ncbi:MAG: MFS transporter [Acidovorax sp.]|jgi:predicted MFS family arabinose efflux permease|nr:MFS transporter [Acidovorax sp.]